MKNTPQDQRLVPWKGCKVFGIGLGKTGTTSLAGAMGILGFRVKHSPKEVNELHQFDFSNDIAVAWRFRFLDHVYPDAKFILTIRDISSWLNSCATKAERHKSKGSLRRKENRFMCFGRIDYDEGDFKRAYERHMDAVTAHFRQRNHKLLVMDICAGDGWEKLCPFLGIKAPPIQFPHANQRAA